jgi:hypothetical protein
MIEVVDEIRVRAERAREGVRDSVASSRRWSTAPRAVEVSRLSRSSEDWRRLLGLCSVAGVVVIDEQAMAADSGRGGRRLRRWPRLAHRAVVAR